MLYRASTEDIVEVFSLTSLGALYCKSSLGSGRFVNKVLSNFILVLKIPPTTVVAAFGFTLTPNPHLLVELPVKLKLSSILKLLPDKYLFSFINCNPNPDILVVKSLGVVKLGCSKS